MDTYSYSLADSGDVKFGHKDWTKQDSGRKQPSQPPAAAAPGGGIAPQPTRAANTPPMPPASAAQQPSSAQQSSEPSGVAPASSRDSAVTSADVSGPGTGPSASGANERPPAQAHGAESDAADNVPAQGDSTASASADTAAAEPAPAEHVAAQRMHSLEESGAPAQFDFGSGDVDGVKGGGDAGKA